MVILDEYDVLVREKVKSSIFDPYLSFLNGMFKNANLAPRSEERRVGKECRL